VDWYGERDDARFEVVYHFLSVSMRKRLRVKVPLTEADPTRYFRPPYVGHRGWIGVRLDAGPDWQELEAQLARSWRMTAPRRLAARTEG
jgi:hypothetical protein